MEFRRVLFRSLDNVAQAECPAHSACATLSSTLCVDWVVNSVNQKSLRLEWPPVAGSSFSRGVQEERMECISLTVGCLRLLFLPARTYHSRVWWMNLAPPISLSQQQRLCKTRPASKNDPGHIPKAQPDDPGANGSTQRPKRRGIERSHPPSWTVAV